MDQTITIIFGKIGCLQIIFFKLSGKYPNMLAPQLLGRLLTEVKNNHNIRNLLRQCDDEGPVQNALLPTYHCMHTPGGPLKYVSIKVNYTFTSMWSFTLVFLFFLKWLNI